jgi:hypothetical protein
VCSGACQWAAVEEKTVPGCRRAVSVFVSRQHPVSGALADQI